ncbi:MAG TPA: glycosyl transferase [Pseudonocardia sp.]
MLDAIVVTAYALTSFGLYRDLWLGLPTSYLVDSGRDQDLFEWFFAVQARALAHGDLVLYSDLQNHPGGVNLMGNTAMPGLALPLAPVTWLFGPTATWAVVLTLGLAGTATGWYWLFSRHLVRSPWAAAVGGATCAFAPPVISHAHAHPNFTAMFLLPVIVIWLLRLTRAPSPRTAVRDGLVLGLLVGWQVLIGEEPLLILATGLAVYLLVWAVLRPSAMLAGARAALPGLGAGVAVTALLVGYPLWVQFTGPASYHALRHGPAGNDLASLGALPRQSVGGQLLHPGQAVDNPTEQNAFLGWPLLVLLAVVIVWLWRELPARLASITGLLTLALSLGSPVFADARSTGIPGPWWLLHRLPLYESLIEARLTFACVPAMGMLLALACDRVLRRRPRVLLGPLTSRRLWFASLALAVLPVLPVRFAVQPRLPTPAYFTDGQWSHDVRPGRAIVPVPLPGVDDARALHWQVATGFGFPIAEGYFVGPAGPRHEGTYGAEHRPTSQLLAGVAATGVVPPVGPAQRTNAVTDLRYWRADAVVLADHPRRDALRATVEALLGPGQERGGVEVWDVRGLVG